MEVIIDLYARFIHDSALQDARDVFRAARWDEGDNTVQGWKDTLQQLIDNMDVAPDEYSVKNKFMSGLPPNVRNSVFTDKLSVEYNDWEELYQSALDIEYALKVERRFSKMPRVQCPMTDNRNDRHDDDRRAEWDPLMRQNWGRKILFFKTYVPPNQAQPLEHSKKDITSPKPLRTDPMKDKGKAVARKPLEANLRDRNMREHRCFRCGQTGHIASSSACPEYGKKPSYDQIRAAHTIIMDTMSDTVGSEDHPMGVEREASLESDEGEDNVTYEIYEASDDADDSGDEVEQLHRIAEDASDCSGYESSTSGSSDNVVVYGCPSSSMETMTSIPLFEFGGAIAPDVVKNTLVMRMMKDMVDQPDQEGIRAMTEARDEHQQQGRVHLRVSEEPGDRPVPKDKRCLVTLVNINGLDAVTLWDSGSTSMAMSPAFADIAKVLVSRLRNPVVLQLGTVGSRAKINFGTTTKVKTTGFTGTEYFDVVNIDKYDAIIGTLFMHRNQVVLDFEKKQVVVNGHPVVGRLIDGEEADKIARRYRLRKPEGAAK